MKSVKFFSGVVVSSLLYNNAILTVDIYNNNRFLGRFFLLVLCKVNTSELIFCLFVIRLFLTPRVDAILVQTRTILWKNCEIFCEIFQSTTLEIYEGMALVHTLPQGSWKRSRLLHYSLLYSEHNQTNQTPIDIAHQHTFHVDIQFDLFLEMAWILWQAYSNIFKRTLNHVSGTSTHNSTKQLLQYYVLHNHINQTGSE